MRHVLVRIALVVLVLIALVLIALALILVWPSLFFSQPIVVYPQSFENTYTAESIKSEHWAWLEIRKKDGVTHIKLVCENLTDKEVTLQYSFFIEKDGPEGKLSSRQSGIVHIKAGQKGVIVRAKVSGFWKVSMAVYKDGHLVARDERIYPGQEI
ncbi:MAG: curli-like amyloid fiber formation chaperone CsgH [bacterium]